MTALPEVPSFSEERRRNLDRVRAITRNHPPPDLAAIVREELRVDLSTRYAGVTIAHPFGKGSGQLSCKFSQVVDDVESGLAFIVLKTVIAENPSGSRSMNEWASEETKMRVERRMSLSGREGWTVTWKGRGWPGSLDEYLAFFEESLRAGARRDVPVIPSVKFHLPDSGEAFSVEEYAHTTSRLLETWDRAGGSGPMLMEKDFSPTLAGDARAQARDQVLIWLREVPELVDGAAAGRVRLGVKVMNALADDAFQVEMLRVLCEQEVTKVAYLVVFNRLFDADLGVAYGGWDLSDRNLRVLDRARETGLVLPSLSATGNICSGRMMLEYALRGCENGQLHTFFQLPHSEYTADGGPRSARALHTLLLHPSQGLVPWMWHLHEAGAVAEVAEVIRFRDVVESAGG